MQRAAVKQQTLEQTAFNYIYVLRESICYQITNVLIISTGLLVEASPPKISFEETVWFCRIVRRYKMEPSNLKSQIVKVCLLSNYQKGTIKFRNVFAKKNQTGKSRVPVKRKAGEPTPDDLSAPRSGCGVSGSSRSSYRGASGSRTPFRARHHLAIVSQQWLEKAGIK